MARALAKAYTDRTKHYKKRSFADRFEAGLASPEPTLAEARCEAHALFSARLETTELGRASLETLAVVERMVWEINYEASLCPLIAAARGLPDAVEAVVRATLLTMGTHDYDRTSSLVVLPTTDRHRLPREPCLPLRHLVCAASEAEYAAARERAERLRKGGDRLLRSCLAYTFPDEDWANADLKASLASKEPPWFLLSAVSESTLVRRWLERGDAFNISVYALNLACVLPAAEAVAIFAECLRQLLVKPKYGALAKTPPRDIAQALACIGTEEAAAVLAPYASHPVLAPLVLAFFRERPELGAALQTQAKGRKLEATAARVLGKRKKVAAVAGPMAMSEDLPPVLRDPPWRAKKSKEKPIVVEGLVPLGLDLERVALVRPPAPLVAPNVRDMTAKELSAWKKEASAGTGATAAGETIHADFELHSLGRGSWEYRRVPEFEGLWAWNEKEAYLEAGALAWVERHGLAALPGFLARDWVRWLAYEGYDEYFDAVQSLVSPRTAESGPRFARRRRDRLCYETRLMLRGDLLERFDEALGKLPVHKDALRPGAKPSAVATTERTLGSRLPKTLSALYAWHDGETSTGTVFDALCRSDVDASWDSSDGRDFSVRFMTLAELERDGVTEAYLEKSTNSMWLARIEEPCVVCRLVPFLWIRGRDGDDAREPSDDDWRVAVDDVSGAVWLYEPAGEGLELVERQAGSLDEWLRTRTMKLEKIARQVVARAPAAVPVIGPPAQVLLDLLVEKRAVELAEGVDVAEAAARLGPLLAQNPRKIAVTAAMEFFYEDESIAELFVDDDVLRRIVGQFTA